MDDLTDADIRPGSETTQVSELGAQADFLGTQVPDHVWPNASKTHGKDT